MAVTDTLTTRESVRRAALEDLVARCELVAVPIEGGDLDGIAVVTMGRLRDQMTGALQTPLAPPTDKHAEVSTPASVTVSASCPECEYPVRIVVTLNPVLTVDDDSAKLSVKASSKASPHVHNQQELPGIVAGQLGLGDVAGEVKIDDLRLRILRAVYDAGAARVADINPGPPPTLDVIAARLELATESDRGDLEHRLYHYSQLEEPLVSVLSAKGSPVEYALTDAGEAMVAEAEDGEDGEGPADG